MSAVSNTVDSAVAPNPQALIAKERAQSKFNPATMNNFLETSKENSDEIKRLYQQMERDPILRPGYRQYELTKHEQRAVTARRIGRLAQYSEDQKNPTFQGLRSSLMSVFDPQVATRIGVNLGLFIGCIRGNGTKSQHQYWNSDKETGYIKGMYGCFGMTELGHGSNVAGLETTATFDKNTDEFVINTPHIGATKWWIGGAAHSSTHCSVYARLIVDGKDYGVKTFIVPLRDANHHLMPGVAVGDIGAKMGRDGIDNGWIQFSSVRIPRFFMLQKFCKVTKEGKVTLPPLEQLSYSALLGGRVLMVMDSYRWSAKVVTVALRYAVARRQFKSQSQADGSETQLINYPLHQRRLLPFLAQAFVFSVGSWKLEKTFHEVLDTLDHAVEANDMKRIFASIEDMKSLFLDSAALKSTATWLTADCIDQCRQSCGGHGYSAYSGFGRTFNDWVVQCTWEGDNSVLAMSVGKPVIKAVVEVLEKDKKQTGSIGFLNHAKVYDNDKVIFSSTSDLAEIENVLKAIEVLITRIGIQGAKVVAQNSGNFDSVGAPSLAISKLKAHHYFLQEFDNKIKSNLNKELNPYLLAIGQLYCASNVIEKFAGEFLTYNIIPGLVAKEITNVTIPALCAEVRKNVVAYTDSFQMPDLVLNSALGQYDGNVYENYFSTVKLLNPPEEFKAHYSGEFESVLNRGSLDARERFEKSAEVASILSK